MNECLRMSEVRMQEKFRSQIFLNESFPCKPQNVNELDNLRIYQVIQMVLTLSLRM